MKILFLLLLLTLFFTSSCFEPTASIQTLSGSTMGTTYSIKIYSLPIKDIDKLQKEMDQYLRYINSVYSTYDKNSELSLLNKFNEEELSVSDELLLLLEKSQEINKETSGYFDVTIGPIVNLWGFGPEKFQSAPSQSDIDEVKDIVGMDKFSIEDGRVKKTNKKVYLDLSAIAKGRGVDLVYNLLESKKFENFLIEIGGEIRAMGTRDGKNPWKIGIEVPHKEKTGDIQSIVRISGRALATSGSYRNFKISGAKKLSHTIDPLTLSPTDHNLISVSVISSDCATADAYATAFMAMGEKKAYKLAKNNNISAYFIIKDDNNIITKHTNSFKEYLLK